MWIILLIVALWLIPELIELLVYLLMGGDDE